MGDLTRRAEEGLDGKKPGWGAVQAEYEELLGPDGARMMSEEPGLPMEEKRLSREDLMALMRARE